MMSDTILAVIIGGGIGVIPNLVIILIERWKQHSQQKHELHMKQLELYNIPKRDAILCYMKSLGKVLSNSVHTGEIVDDFFSYHEQAMLFVSDETRELMKELKALVANRWIYQIQETVKPKDAVTLKNIHESDTLKRLNEAMPKELHLSQ
jgi:hypothetical protein